MESNGIGNYEQPAPLRQIIQNLDNKVDKHIEQQQELNKKLERICYAVLGDPDAQIPGLVHRMKKSEEYISRDKKIKWFGAGLAATGGTTAGIMQYWNSLKHIFGL